MIGESFEAADLVSPPFQPALVMSEDPDDTVSDATSVEAELPMPDKVSWAVSNELSDEEPQPDSNKMDIAFVGDQPSSGDEETLEGDGAALADEALETGEDPGAMGEDIQHWHERELLGADEFAFHPDESEARSADSSEQDAEDPVTFVWVCEWEESGEASNSTSAEGGHANDLSFVADDPGDTLL